MEMDFSPFKRGKISLENVKLRDNKPFSYTIIFYGNLITLKDLLGDDELRHLPQLDDYTHDYSSSNVKTGLQSGLSSGKIVYPLISHTKRFYYDSATSSPQYSGNLYYNTTANNIGLAFDDLKPAIKCLTIIEAIEDKYDIQFTRDFFNNTEFSNLYLWLSRNKGPVGGDENQEEILSRICGDWGFSSGDLGFAVDGDTWSFTVENLNASFEATLTVTTSGGNTSIPFKMKAIDYVSGTTLKESTMAAGSSRTLTFEVAQSFNPVNYQVKWIIESNTAISFTPQIELTKFIITNGTISGQDDAVYNINGTGNSISTVSEIIITQNVPKLKVIDFLTGIFKMFNLTAYYVEDVGDADFDKIKVDTLDEFYADRVNNPSEGEWDITKFVDTSRLQVNRAFEYNEIDFSYQEPSTLLSINHQEQFNDIFGDEEVRPQNIDRGTPYEVTLPFEHMKFERLFDENETSSSPYDLADTAYLTDILWGYSAAGEFTSDTDVTPNTGNYEPVLTKPLVFYAIQETGLTSAKGIKWISDGTPISLTQYYRPSNTNEDGTSSTAPSFTINFDDEIDEWNLQNYGGTTNSLFKKFYATYINGIFNEKKRIYKLKAYLSTDILANYRLNDELVIQNKVYRINSIETNFNTEVSSLELLNKLSDD
tara:strand:- start:4071 stop:6026 length:1956 start_codon:yes stop_codon:yes gene_type:complete